MHIDTGSLAFDLADTRLVRIHHQPRHAPIADVSAAVHHALEHPHGFPALRRALTPDDHVAVFVDEALTDLPRFLTPLLEHLTQADITPDAITLLCIDPNSAHEWKERLPSAFREVRIEIHDPHNRKKLSYLATTKHGKRIYLNRTAVDADQLVVLSRRHYDPVLGVGGALGAIYPALSDAESQKAALAKLSMADPDSVDWPERHEAAEVAWLLGAPFFVQIIEGAGEEVAHVLTGVADSADEGQRLQDNRWRVELDAPAEVVIAQVSGDPSRHTFADLASAVACASRVVRDGGRIILVSTGKPELGEGAQLLRQSDTAADALTLLMENQPADKIAAFQWASAACQAKIYLLSQLPANVVEELFAIPLEHADDVERLVGSGRCLFLQDADKTLAVIRGGSYPASVTPATVVAPTTKPVGRLKRK